ncbi:winged helix-turn-helix transcriptional regulator [Methanobacterium sp. CWC-01]|jgi:DNA-binding transcriptional ArsR family regulator|uniref:ArsR/SmtB family transcription factor n=1 Tax=Methanobacterium aridiramus TaxID=2584467 RepID=UPI0025751192|nr:metalloregulator ArsR/SmtB family transcription factor [Methanobacterium sp. CWC-01]WJI10121.1 winged helix-turn-helix transcriptional regulator [Methanobacterium sp. CWC-01]
MMRINSRTSSLISSELEELFKALGNVNRLLLVYSLASGEVERISVTEMSKIMGLTQPAASQHLKVLKTAKILIAQKEGNYIYYTFNKQALQKHKKTIDFLFNCAFAKCEQLEKHE